MTLTPNDDKNLEREILERAILERANIWSELNPWSDKDNNYYRAEQDIKNGITSAELDLIENRIRSMIQHENDLLNHRIQWFLTINGFLLTATGITISSIGKTGVEKLYFVFTLAGVGILICFSFFFSLGIGRKGVGRLSKLWDHYSQLYYRDKNCASYYQIGVLGWIANPWSTRLSPWQSLPFIFFAAWISILSYGIYRLILLGQ